MKPTEIYDYVTNKIIDILEQKLEGTWEKPWISIDADKEPARNPSTNAYYRGINQFVLSIFGGIELGYLKNEYATYKQITEMGGHVLKGSKSLPVVFYKTAYIQDKKYLAPEVVKTMNIQEMRERGVETVPILKLYQVFNLHSQTEGLPEHHYQIPQAPKSFNFIEKNEAAENLIKSTGAKIEYKLGDRAFYNRVSDTITLPLREQFNSTEELYSSALHEIVHWSGAPNRLNRVKGKVFGDSDYAQEELVSELSAAILCAYLGFEKHITNSAQYIKGWLSVLKEDNKAIFKASADAQKACDYILGGVECAAYTKDFD